MHERHNSSIIIYCRCRRQRPKSTVMETHSKFTVYITLILLCFFFSKQANSNRSICMIFFQWLGLHFTLNSLHYFYTYGFLYILIIYLQCYAIVATNLSFCLVVDILRYFVVFFHHIFVVVSFVSFLPKRYGQNTPLMPTFRFQIIHYMRANQ